MAQEAEFAGKLRLKVAFDKSKTRFEQKLPEEEERHDELELPPELHESRDSLLNITTGIGADKQVAVGSITILGKVGESGHSPKAGLLKQKRVSVSKKLALASFMSKSDLRHNFMRRLRTNVDASIAAEGRSRRI